MIVIEVSGIVLVKVADQLSHLAVRNVIQTQWFHLIHTQSLLLRSSQVLGK